MSVTTFTVEIDLPGTEDLLKSLNLEEGGKAQRFFSDTVMRHSDKYVPFDTGALKNAAYVSAGGDSIVYPGVYARYLWYGDLYVDPITLKGAFHDPISGRFWSRPGVQKIKDPRGRKLSYAGAPTRGERWVERMWDIESNTIVNEVEAFIMMNKKI